MALATLFSNVLIKALTVEVIASAAASSGLPKFLMDSAIVVWLKVSIKFTILMWSIIVFWFVCTLAYKTFWTPKFANTALANAFWPAVATLISGITGAGGTTGSFGVSAPGLLFWLLLLPALSLGV
ncbi:hypothetical protein J2Z62_000450 [Mycoplasmoides fastidiosum]|uniref:Uncharacterized protein n=1 Tax=Mycoplasmoides fastidiosum TaxID=92758 RepID=A0ABU0LZ80_9BACT|nr:hypothetical protein [Mycoplasmoides fastidiosum]MDQ0514012.1 hypothetical protein [Mycoplasmoides fastidiosum]UUD37576.1 hypothetical protein NPA10_03345 [Mycoplasmoides fastidiosum]